MGGNHQKLRENSGKMMLNILYEPCSNMGIPTPSQRIIKRHERKVGKAIEAAIDESCEKALSLEKAGSKTDTDHTAKINV